MVAVCTGSMPTGTDGATSLPLPRATNTSIADRSVVPPPCAPPDPSAIPPYAVVCTDFAHIMHPPASVLPSAYGSPLPSRLGGLANASAGCASYPPRVSVSSVQCGRPGSFMQLAYLMHNCEQNSMIVHGGCLHGKHANWNGWCYIAPASASDEHVNR